MTKTITLIGYSGHAYVCIDVFNSMDRQVTAYCDREAKSFNPYGLTFVGSEESESGLEQLKNSDYFISIGDNRIRKRIQDKLLQQGLNLAVNAIDKSAIIGSGVQLGKGLLIAPGAIINAQAQIGEGTVCNTGSIIEHEVKIGTYSFIGPGATLLGGVEVGHNCFIGANAVVLQNTKIGDNAVIGAGTVVLKDIPANSKVVGNPQRLLTS